MNIKKTHNKHYMNRRRLIRYGSLLLVSSIAACSKQDKSSTNQSDSTVPGLANKDKQLEKITFGTNWFAQAEHGGFYQAVATGIYKEYGLDVTIKMGGPQVNGTQLLMGGAIDFFMGNSIDSIKAIEQGIPKITVAAIFQKSPQVIMVHPEVDLNSLEKLKGKPIFVSSSATTTYWGFLKNKYGFTDDQKRPYNFNAGPFLADKNSAQQGYLTSEPLTIEKEGKFRPIVFLLADYGYSPYETTIETTKNLVETNPDLVQRFVDASIKGWYSYLKNPFPANELIKRDNPKMTDEQITYGFQKLNEYGIILSGDAEKQGIGNMTDSRWKMTFESMVAAQVCNPNVDYQKAFILKFIGKGKQFYDK
jgi:NitT/TauT family transport system substrate-binding protein